ncbi:MAG: nitrogen-specific signal transduction histidine kinase [Candidatus Promineifilaceae bacterium]|jgi:nitrogen-specific signal transduction histidine kinase
MNDQIYCILYTTDKDLQQRVSGYVPSNVSMNLVSTSGQFLRALEQHGPAIVLLDVRGSETIELLREVGKRWQDNVVIALGVPRSDPLLEALDVGVFAAQDLDFDGATFETLMRQAANYLGLNDQVQMLRDQLACSQKQSASTVVSASAVSETGQYLRQFFRPLRHFDNVTGLLQEIVDGIANEAGVLRVGIFAGSGTSSTYSLMAAVGCLDDTRELGIHRDDALVRWLEVNAQMVTRGIVSQLHDLRERRLLQRALDLMGAELIIPLQGRTDMLGWMFLGKRITGMPFEEASIKNLVVFAEHAAIALENAMLYQEITLQKSFAETLLHSLPVGIIASDADERVGWYNDAAEQILSLKRGRVLNHSINALGNPVAEHLRLSLRGRRRPEDVFEWEDERTSRYLSLRTARLLSGEECWGAVAFVHDLTRERLLSKRQKELDHAAFWTELAAGMSHEIRNPLVAIKTFAQLLPERYHEDDFRTQFSGLMSQEVDRLDSVIKEINRFANHPKLDRSAVQIRDVVEQGIHEASLRLATQTVNMRVEIPARIPSIFADFRAMSECFAHLFINCTEALKGQNDAAITLSARYVLGETDGTEYVEVSVRDNGGGIPPDIKSNVFSPFCTTKSRAMGLGLPIVQRTVSEHDGRVAINSSPKGTSVVISVPVAHALEEQAV